MATLSSSSSPELFGCCKDGTCCKLHATPLQEVKASGASSHDQDREREETKAPAFKFFEEKDLSYLPTFHATCKKAAEYEYYRKYPNFNRKEDTVQKDMLRYVKENTRKQEQARLGSLKTIGRFYLLSNNKGGGVLKVLKKCREVKNYSEEKIELKLAKNLCSFVLKAKAAGEPEKKKAKLTSGCKRLKMDDMHITARLIGITMFPKVDGLFGDVTSGTFEAHVDSFVYKTSNSSFNTQFMFKFDNVYEVFVQGVDDEVSEDRKMIPLLHFQLRQPIMLGKEKTDHIQFRLVPNVVGKNELDRANDLRGFVLRVGKKLWEKDDPPFGFYYVNKQGVFCGRLQQLERVFILSCICLVSLEDTPFCAVILKDIEFVYFARLRHGEVDMTIVFSDFSRPMLKIEAIPLASLESLKRFFSDVKYYESSVDLDWHSIIKKIADNPQKFIKGGWGAYISEDEGTSLFYKHYLLESSEAVMMGRKDKMLE